MSLSEPEEPPRPGPTNVINPGGVGEDPASKASGEGGGSDSGGQASEPHRRPPRRRGKAALEWIAILAVAVLAAVLLRTFVIQPYFIPSGSMEPTLHIGDKVLVNKLSYDFHGIHRGDVVVFKRPPGEANTSIKDLIKRVIGLPGETISAHGGSVYIDGHRLVEHWLPKGTTTSDFGPVHIPSGYYFVMGDNRGDSQDSRFFGPISGKLIVGRAFMIVWPPSQIGGL